MCCAVKDIKLSNGRGGRGDDQATLKSVLHSLKCVGMFGAHLFNSSILIFFSVVIIALDLNRCCQFRPVSVKSEIANSKGCFDPGNLSPFQMK